MRPIKGSNGSPFAQIFSGLGIPAAPHILNGGVITAALMVIVILGVFEDTRIALYVGAVWLGLLLLACQLWVKGNGRRRAELVDETSPLPVVGTGEPVRS